MSAPLLSVSDLKVHFDVSRRGFFGGGQRAIVKAVDGYLFAAILLIFALGLYELFVSKIERAENSDFAARLLRIRSIDDLKDRLAKVILLILVVKFFQQALEVKYASALDLLYLGLGILFVGAALFISGVKLGKKSSDH